MVENKVSKVKSDGYVVQEVAVETRKVIIHPKTNEPIEIEVAVAEILNGIAEIKAGLLG